MLNFINNINRIFVVLCATVFAFGVFIGCDSAQNGSGEVFSSNDDTATVTLFAAKSLNTSLDEVIEQYCKSNPSVKIQTNYDSSGTLLTQITEGGAPCDIFFSASEKQIGELERQGLIVDGTKENLLKNCMCVVTFKGSNTKVTGLNNIGEATSLAIASGSVPIGYYTRKALVNTGLISKNKKNEYSDAILQVEDEKDITASSISKIEDEEDITSEEISRALDGVEINECINAGAVVAAIAEHSNEVGTVYYSDMAGFEDELEILEMVSTDITGDIVYPVALVKNTDADERIAEEAGKFIEYLKSDEAKKIFEKYHFEI